MPSLVWCRWLGSNLDSLVFRDTLKFVHVTCTVCVRGYHAPVLAVVIPGHPAAPAAMLLLLPPRYRAMSLPLPRAMAQLLLVPSPRHRICTPYGPALLSALARCLPLLRAHGLAVALPFMALQQPMHARFLIPSGAIAPAQVPP
jgi:hypothetical protein